MLDALTPELRRRLEGLRLSDADKRLPFIVKLRPGADPASISRIGMAIDSHIPNPPLLLGTMTAAQALTASESDDVVRVEYDAPGVRALDETD